MKYFVEVVNGGVYHISDDDAIQTYDFFEKVEVIESGTAQKYFDEGKEIITQKTNIRRIWGEEMSDRELFMKTMKGEIFKRTAMSIRLPKAKDKKESETKSNKASSHTKSKPKSTGRTISKDQKKMLVIALLCVAIFLSFNYS